MKIFTSTFEILLREERKYLNVIWANTRFREINRNEVLLALVEEVKKQADWGSDYRVVITGRRFKIKYLKYKINFKHNFLVKTYRLMMMKFQYIHSSV